MSPQGTRSLEVPFNGACHGHLLWKSLNLHFVQYVSVLKFKYDANNPETALHLRQFPDAFFQNHFHTMRTERCSYLMRNRDISLFQTVKDTSSL